MMKLLRVVAIGVAVIALLTAASDVSAAQQDKQSVRVFGSESPAWMVDQFGKEFAKNKPGASVTVVGGKPAGIASIAAKECDLTMLSRALTPEEKEGIAKRGVKLQEKLIGWGGLVIIANPKNPVNELTVDQVRKVLAGEFTNWKQVGGPDESIAVMTIGEEWAGTLHFVRQQLLHKPLAANAITKTYFRAVISGVSEEDKAISFVRVRNIVKLKDEGKETKVKIIAIKKDESSPAVLPSRSTVDDGSYPLTRPYFLYYDANTCSDLAKEFADFCGNKCPRPIQSAGL